MDPVMPVGFGNSLALIVDKQLAQCARKRLEEHSYWDDKRRLTRVTNNHIAIPVNAECGQALLCTERKGLQGMFSFLQTSCNNKDGDECSEMGTHQSVGLAEPTGLWKSSSSENGLQSNIKTATDPPCCFGSPERAPFTTLLQSSIEESQVLGSGSRLLLPSSPNDASECTCPKSGHNHSLASAHEELRVICSGRLFDFEAKLVCIDLPLSKKAKLTTPYDRLRMMIEGWVKEGKIQWKEELAKEIPKNWEKHGDLVLLSSSCFQDPVWTSVPDLWTTVATTLNCTRIARRGRIQSDDFRSPRTELVLGTDPYVEHRDNGIIYTFDIRYSMFSSGNITEKLRIADLDCSKETVVDLYAGIGYFTLPYLVHAKAKLLYACEWNPHAVLALRNNLKLNSVDERCIVLEGDNRKVCPKGVADRVNLGLIPSSEQGWPVSCAALNPITGGVLHIHGNVDSYPHKEWNDPQNTSFSVSEKSSNSRDPDTLDYTVSNYYNTCTQGATVSACDGSVPNPQMESRDTQPIVVKNSMLLKDKVESLSHGITGSTPQRELGNDMDMSSFSISNRESIVRDCEMKTESICPGQGLCQSDLFDDNLSDSCSEFKQGKWVEWGHHATQKIKELLYEEHGNPWHVQMVHIEHVKSYAPHIDHVVVDLKCQPIS